MAEALQQLGVARILAGRPEDAVPQLQESAALLTRDRHERETTSCLDALAAVALARGHHDAAATAVAVAQVARGKLGVSPWPSAQAFVSRLTDGVRSAVGTERFAALSARADSLDLFEVLDRTLQAAASTGSVSADGGKRAG